MNEYSKLYNKANKNYFFLFDKNIEKLFPEPKPKTRESKKSLDVKTVNEKRVNYMKFRDLVG